MTSPFNIENFSSGSNIWRLPTWSHELGRSVVPLFIRCNGFVVPIGTGFFIAECGVCITAGHVVDELYKNSLTGGAAQKFVEYNSEEHRIKSLLGQSSESKIEALPMYALSVQSEVSKNSRTALIGLSGTLTVVEPTDIGIVVFAEALTGAPSDIWWKTLPLSPLAPRIGETVYCIGHCSYGAEARMTSERFFKFDVNEIEAAFDHEFTVSKGRITDIYTEKYINGYGEGPCFRIDCRTEHGQSGGPVLNENGYVCGINSSATLDSDENSCLAAALWPALNGEFGVPKVLTKSTQLSTRASLMELIEKHYVNTDDSLNNRVEYSHPNGAVSYLPIEAIVNAYEKDGIEIPKEVRDKYSGLVGFYSEMKTY